MAAQNNRGYRVAPMRISGIRELAVYYRRMLGTPTGPINLVKLIEHVLPELVPGFDWDIVERDVIGDDYARTFPDRLFMQIRDDVYDGLHEGNGRDRFTIGHELGHLFMHQGALKLARTTSTTRAHEVYEDSEWQADTFSAEFLMPFQEVRAMQSPQVIADYYNVSWQAAVTRFNKTRAQK